MFLIFTLWWIYLAVGTTVGIAPIVLPVRAWNTTWEQRPAPLAAWRFNRQTKRLAITLPGPGYVLDAGGKPFRAPYLLQRVDGDFAVQVRVGGDFCKAGAFDSCHKAGILVTDGHTVVKLQRFASPEDSAGSDCPSSLVCGEFVDRDGTRGRFNGGSPSPSEDHLEALREAGGEIYLRLERRGGHLGWAFSKDGKNWHRLQSLDIDDKLAKVVKVGLVAESSAPGTFRPWFDQFKLTKLKAPPRDKKE